MNMNLTIQELQKDHIPYILGYWQNASQEELLAMGIDLNHLSVLDNLGQRLEKQLELANEKKGAFVLVAFIDEQPVGHCYVNNLTYGKDAFMHLHIWKSINLKKGLGSQMVKQSIPHFFEKLKLQTLFCEPAALNPAPNKTLEKIGFKYIKSHTTIPAGWTFEMEVNLWELTLEDFENKF